MARRESVIGQGTPEHLQGTVETMETRVLVEILDHGLILKKKKKKNQLNNCTLFAKEYLDHV